MIWGSGFRFLVSGAELSAVSAIVDDVCLPQVCLYMSESHLGGGGNPLENTRLVHVLQRWNMLPDISGM